MKNTMTIICGIPRSGKSTWMKKNKVKEVVISPDDIRRELFGHQFHALANQFVFGVAEGMATLLLKQGVDVIIDATSITYAVRAKWYRVAKACNSKTKVIWVYAHKDKVKNFAYCLERNELSPEGNKLPQDALLRLANFFEEPDVVYEPIDIYVEYKNVHRRKLPIDKRMIVSKGDSLMDIRKQWSEKWHVAEDKDEDS